MDKELRIKVKIDRKFEIVEDVDMDNWNGATEDERIDYIKNIVIEYLTDNMYEIVDDLYKDITFKII